MHYHYETMEGIDDRVRREAMEIIEGFFTTEETQVPI